MHDERHDERRDILGRRGFIKLIAFSAAAVAMEPSLNNPDLHPELESVGPLQSEEMKYFTFNQYVPHYLVTINSDLLQEQSREFGFPLGNSSNLAISLLPEFSFKNCFVEEQPYISLRKPSPEATEIMIAEGLFVRLAKDFKRRSPATSLDETYLSIMLSRTITRGLFDTLLLKEEISFEDSQAKFKRYSDSVVKRPGETSEVYFASMQKFNHFIFNTLQA